MQDPPRSILAIETSQRAGSVAVRGRGSGREGGGIIIKTESLDEKGNLDAELFPAIERLMRGCGLAPGDLEGLAVSIGPGGFSGLRIAISAVKVLGETLGVPIAAVPSALVAAASTPGAAEFPALVVLAVKGERAWCTRVGRDAGGRLGVLGEGGMLCCAGDVDLAGIRSVLGDRFLPDSFRHRAREGGVPIVEPAFDARACLEVGSGMIDAGEVTQPQDLLPIYAREPEAVSLWQARTRDGVRSRPGEGRPSEERPSEGRPSDISAGETG